MIEEVKSKKQSLLPSNPLIYARRVTELTSFL